MNGAESLIHTLVKGGVDTCFMNPGTSEIQFVLALDSVPEMRPILCLFEGVAAGCADGYARMTGRPAATLLHLGPGLGNGIANLHNARKAQSPLVNIVGDHASRHLQYDAPLTSDVEGIARPVSDWVRTSSSASMVAQDGAEAIQVAKTAPGRLASLILPAHTAWQEATEPITSPEPPAAPKVSDDRIDAIVEVLGKGEDTVILVGNHVMGFDSLTTHLSQIAAVTGARIFGNKFVNRVSRGAGRPAIRQLPYAVDEAIKILQDAKHVIRVGTKDPVGFFAYPKKPSLLCPPDAEIHILVEIQEDMSDAVERLADRLDVENEPISLAESSRPPLPAGPLTPDAVWTSLAAFMPENSIVSEEAITSYANAWSITRTAPPHDWMQVTGGAIGQCLPLATGAAVACPDRQVFAMEADGSGMYTLQALWTQARESLNVVNVIFSNRTYQILINDIPNMEGDDPGPKASAMMSLDSPPLDWVLLSEGMGVPAIRVETAESFSAALSKGIQEKGPFLIEAVI